MLLQRYVPGGGGGVDGGGGVGGVDGGGGVTAKQKDTKHKLFRD